MEHTKGTLHRHDLCIHIERTESGKVVEHTCIANGNPTRQLPAVINMEHLVRCWNAHDDLLAACEYSKRLLLNGVGQSTHAVALFEAAIAKGRRQAY